MKKFFSTYRLELFVLLLVFLGIFLLVEPFDIRATLYGWLLSFWGFIKAIGEWVANTVAKIIGVFTLSDAIGIAFLLLAGIFALWRMRVRLLESGHIRRIQRKTLDRVLGVIIGRTLRRYICANHECGWSGVLYGGKHRTRISEQGSETQHASQVE
jgi:hypothetical protein